MPKDITEIILEELREFRTEMRSRVAILENKEAENRGAWKVLAALSALVSAGVAYLVEYLRHA